MESFNRNTNLLHPTIVYGCVAVNPTLSREKQFEQWLDTQPPPPCRRHYSTRMVLDRKASRSSSLSHEVSIMWYRRIVDQNFRGEIPDGEARENSYPFEARFRCPACALEYAKAPPEFYESSFDTFVAGTQELAGNLAKCREFASQVNAHRCGFLLMCGTNGNGKTRLACNVVRELESDDALYLTQGGITLLHRKTYGERNHYLVGRGKGDSDDDRPQAIWEIAQEVFFLILDEIGTKALSPDEMLLFDEVLKHRYDHRKPTILISNLPMTGTADKPGLKEFLGDALVDRIADATGNRRFILQFSGESYRRTGGESYLSGLTTRPNA